MKAYFGMSTTKPLFDFRDIRPKGAELITVGGKAPGPEPLKECLFQIQKVLDRKEDGEQLSPIEVSIVELKVIPSAPYLFFIICHLPVPFSLSS